jgi:hypothetical protein
VVHGGEFDMQEIAGRRELIGPDVVVAHRLLKNSVPMREYALVTSARADVAAAFELRPTEGRDEYADIGDIDYFYVDLQPVREAFEKSREVYLTEEDADIVVSVEIEAPPDLVWRLAMDTETAPRWAPTLVEVETLSGEVDHVGSVHTCLHGGGLKMVHLRVAFDEAGRRCTDRLWNVPLVNELYQTWEAEPSALGTKFSFYYALTPRLPIAGRIAKPLFLRKCRKQAERDVQGLKALCEAEARALPAKRT